MSRFSGKCDLFDHISGMGGWFDKEGNPVKFGQQGVSCYYSDEMLDFIAFKKLTNGVIHQHKKITLTPYNHEEVKKLCSEFDYIEHRTQVKDKRCSSGFREEISYTYTYYGKEYTLKDLNKKGIWIIIDIKFNTILDLIPYYPYIVRMSYGSTIYVSNESFIDRELNDHLEHGWYSDFWQHYKKELQDHYREIVLTYFNPTGREVEEEILFTKETLKDNSIKYLGKTSYPIDENFYPKWISEKPRWTSLKIYDEYTIEMSKQDYEDYIGNTCLVYYVKKGETICNLR